MTNFTKKSFSVAMGGEAYRSGWDATFSKAPRAPVEEREAAPADAPKSEVPTPRRKRGKMRGDRRVGGRRGCTRSKG